jgi:hypothetical protein
VRKTIKLHTGKKKSTQKYKVSVVCKNCAIRILEVHKFKTKNQQNSRCKLHHMQSTHDSKMTRKGHPTEV